MIGHSDWLVPDWHAPRVGAVMTTRQGGASTTAFASMNLRDGLGDDPAAVAHNLAVLARATGVPPVLIDQVHGAHVVRLGLADVTATGPLPVADASITTEPGLACVVQVADCLPVLFAAPDGRAVGAAHAGWRGLAAGVLEATVWALCEAASCQAAELQAWLGACIGPDQFEVGADVLTAFGADPAAQSSAHFKAGRPGKWLADLPGLAAARLRTAGVSQLSGGQWCTVSDASRFFSFRRDRITGRMGAAVWIRA